MAVVAVRVAHPRAPGRGRVGKDAAVVGRVVPDQPLGVEADVLAPVISDHHTRLEICRHRRDGETRLGQAIGGSPHPAVRSDVEHLVYPDVNSSDVVAREPAALRGAWEVVVSHDVADEMGAVVLVGLLNDPVVANRADVFPEIFTHGWGPAQSLALYRSRGVAEPVV